jgi:hypothetical protein
LPRHGEPIDNIRSGPPPFAPVAVKVVVVPVPGSLRSSVALETLLPSTTRHAARIGFRILPRPVRCSIFRIPSAMLPPNRDPLRALAEANGGG